MSALSSTTPTPLARARSISGRAGRRDGGIGELHDRAVVAQLEHRRVEPFADAVGEHGRLDPGHRCRFEPARALRRDPHERGERRERLPCPPGNLATGAHRLADDEPPPVDESAQRRGDVSVRCRDRRLHGVARHVSVERLVARAAEEPAGRAHDRRGTPGRCDRGRAGTRRTRPTRARVGRAPRSACGTRRSARHRVRAWCGGCRRGHRASAAAAAMPVMSESCAFQSSTGSRLPPLERIAAVGAHDLGFGRVQARAAAGPFLLDAQQADLLQEARAARRPRRRRCAPAPRRSSVVRASARSPARAACSTTAPASSRSSPHT